MSKSIPIWEKLILTTEEAAEYSNIGINRLYSLTNEPGCPFVLSVGKGTLNYEPLYSSIYLYQGSFQKGALNDGKKFKR